MDEIIVKIPVLPQAGNFSTNLNGWWNAPPGVLAHWAGYAKIQGIDPAEVKKSAEEAVAAYWRMMAL